MRGSFIMAAGAAVLLGGCTFEIGDRTPLKAPAFERRAVADLVGDAAGFALAGCDRADERLTLRSDTRLDPGCVYTAGVVIDRSDVTLDCRGAVIRVSRRVGRAVLVAAGRDEVLSGITVRNCRIEGGTNNLRVTRRGVRSLSPEAAAAGGFRDVVIENSRLYDARGVGLYVDAWVTGVTVRGVEVAGAGNAGIYLEAGSGGTVIRDSEIHSNGYAGTARAERRQGVRTLLAGREGIAVDGSRGNLIVGNVIRDNALGGVFLYKNCGEDYGKKGWWPRVTGADGNRIEGNVIRRERTAVWIASRQNENQWRWDCSDPVAHAQSFYMGYFRTEFFRDRAQGNVVSGNTIEDALFGVRIEDDANAVMDNLFLMSAPEHTARPVLLQAAAHGGRGLSGTVVTGNRFRFPHPFRNGGPPVAVLTASPAADAGLRLGGNIAEDPSGAVAAADTHARVEPPPRDPILLVRAIWN